MKTVFRRLHAVTSLFQGSEHAAHVLHEQLAGASKSRAARGASEQHHTQFFLQLLNGALQRRLLEVQLLGCTSEMEFLGYSNETS